MLLPKSFNASYGRGQNLLAQSLDHKACHFERTPSLGKPIWTLDRASIDSLPNRFGIRNGWLRRLAEEEFRCAVAWTDAGALGTPPHEAATAGGWSHLFMLESERRTCANTFQLKNSREVPSKAMQWF